MLLQPSNTLCLLTFILSSTHNLILKPNAASSEGFPLMATLYITPLHVYKALFKIALLSFYPNIWNTIGHIVGL